MRKLAAVCLCLACILFAQHRLCAQNYLYAVGNTPFSTQIPIENGFINVNNGNLHIEIPLAEHAQRGSLQLNERLVYDSRIWKIVHNGGYSWQPTNVPNSMGGWTFQSGQQSPGNLSQTFLGPTTTIQCGSPYAYGATINVTPYQFIWFDASGASHTFNVVWNQEASTICPSKISTSTLYLEGNSIDASGYTIDVTGTLAQTNPTVTIHDRVGNEIYPTPQDPNGNYWSSDASGNLVDTLGRIPVQKSQSGAYIYYDVLTTNGQRARYTVTTETVDYSTAFHQSAVTDGSGSFTAIQSIQLPDGSKYSFTYDSGTAAGNYGELAGVTLPSGGTITYGFTNFLDSFQNQNRWIHTRLKDGGTTTFAPQTISNCTSSAGCQEKLTVTSPPTSNSPTGNDTVYTFSLDAGSYANASSWNTGIAGYQGLSTGGGSELEIVSNSYTYTSVPWNYTTYLLASTMTTKTTLPDVGLTSQVQTVFGSLGEVDSMAQWDYFSASGSAPASPTLSTIYAYNPFYTSAGQYFGAVQCGSVVTDGSGNKVSQTTCGSDETTGTGHKPLVTTSGLTNHNSVTGSRGNITTVSSWINTGGTLTTTATYDDAGARQTSADPNGTTTYLYDSSDTFTTSVAPPTSSSGVPLTYTSSYDFSTGLITGSTDPNGTQTPYKSYDAFGRVGEVDTLAAGGSMVGQTVAVYFPAQSTGFGSPQSIVDNYLSANQTGVTTTLLDGYGRTSRFAVNNGQYGAGEWYQQDSCYDASGRLQFQSYSYQGAGFSQAKVCSGAGDSYLYDALGRTTKITHVDGSFIQYSYTGRATKVTDENGVTRITQSDALGRITSVCEVSSSTLLGIAPGNCGQDIAATGFLTTYAYSRDSAANQVATVTQGAQTRVFKTDSLGRSVSVSEPERGTTTYSYAYSSTAGLGLTVTRVRPQANQTGSATTTTTTQYDSLGRMVSTGYSDGTPSRGFAYDTNIYWTQTGTNIKGRLAVTGGGTASTWNGSSIGYDATGRVVTIWSCGPASCGTGYQASRPLSFAYDWAGNVTQTSDGASGTINYGRSFAGEITSITNTSYTNLPYNPPNLVSNVVNGPNGPVSFTLGNGLNVARTYDGLGRLNGQWVCSGSTAAYCTGGTQIYGTIGGWKGSQVQIQDDTVQNQQITFGYGDGFNRLTARTVTAGTVQNYTYAYDRYGNRVSQTPLQGGYSFNPTINPANNHITTSGYTYDAAGNMRSDAVHSYTYDAEGNITAVDSGSTATYVYDVFNHRIHVQTPSATNEFIYDYAGRRISTWLSPNNFGSEGRIYWDGQQIGYRSIDGTTYFDHQDTLGTERMRTTFSGTVGSKYTSLPWGDGYSATVMTSGADQDNAHYAGLDRDAESDTEHAQFRNYASAQGRWLAPDPYNGSYDFTNPQSFNRYGYVHNNPLSFTDPSGQDFCGVSAVAEGGLAVTGPIGWATLGACVAGDIFELLGLFGGGPSFHGTLQPRPSSNGGWDGNFGESLGLPQSIKITPNIAGAFGLPDAGCEFGACGGGPMDAVQGVAVYSAVPYISSQSWQQLLAHFYPWYWFNKGGSNIVPGTHYCGPGGWGSRNGPVDEACYQHDVCYDGLKIGAGNVVFGSVPASASAGQSTCDQNLCKATGNNASYTPDQMAQQFWVSWAFSCK